MSNYFTLTKMLVKNMFKRDKTKKTSAGYWVLYIVIALSYLMLAALMVAAIIFLGEQFVSSGIANEFLVLLLIVGMAMVLILGIISMLSYLYFSRDTEFFLSLPIKASTVYMAKLSVIYLRELFTSALLLVPCLIAAGVVMNMGAIFYVTMLFAVLLTPAIPLFLASILAIPLMYIVTFFKSRGALTSVAVILLFGLVFVVYYLVCYKFILSMGNITDLDVVIASMRQWLTSLANVFYPLYALVKFATLTPIFGLSVPVSMLINIAIYLACIGALSVLAILISSKVYSKGAASQLEGGKSKANIKVTYTASSATKALAKKEWREMIRTPAFAFQCLSGIVLCPILLVFMSVMGSMGGAAASGEVSAPLNPIIETSITWLTNIFFILFVGVGLNIGAMTCISREGDKFYYCKMLPVSFKSQLQAKAIVYIAVSSLTILLGVVTISIFDFNALYMVLSLGFLLIYNYGFINFAIFFDLNKPKLDWTTPNEAVKQNKNTVIPMFINIGISIIVLILPIIFIVIFPNWIGVLLSWLFLYITSIAFALIMHFVLYKNCDRLFNRIQS